MRQIGKVLKGSACNYRQSRVQNLDHPYGLDQPVTRSASGHCVVVFLISANSQFLWRDYRSAESNIKPFVEVVKLLLSISSPSDHQPTNTILHHQLGTRNQPSTVAGFITNCEMRCRELTLTICHVMGQFSGKGM